MKIIRLEIAIYKKRYQNIHWVSLNHIDGWFRTAIITTRDSIQIRSAQPCPTSPEETHIKRYQKEFVLIGYFDFKIPALHHYGHHTRPLLLTSVNKKILDKKWEKTKRSDNEQIRRL